MRMLFAFLADLTIPIMLKYSGDLPPNIGFESCVAFTFSSKLSDFPIGHFKYVHRNLRLSLDNRMLDDESQ